MKIPAKTILVTSIVLLHLQDRIRSVLRAVYWRICASEVPEKEQGLFARADWQPWGSWEAQQEVLWPSYVFASWRGENGRPFGEVHGGSQVRWPPLSWTDEKHRLYSSFVILPFFPVQPTASQKVVVAGANQLIPNGNSHAVHLPETMSVREPWCQK